MPPATSAAERAAAPLPLRVCFLGERARAWLGAWVDQVPPEAIDGSGAGAGLDALVLESGPRGVPLREVERLAARARAAGARVIGLSDGTEPELGALCDLALAEPGGRGEPISVRPVDPRVVNPLGFRHSDVAGFAAHLEPGRGELGGVRELLAEVAQEEPVLLFSGRELAGGELPRGVLRVTPPEGGLEALLPQLKERLGALDHPALHASVGERAAALVTLAAAGVPVVAAELSEATRRLLGEELAQALAGISWRELADLERRERVSVTLRRAALKHHSLDARWRQLAEAAGIAVPPRAKVSVILSTRREEWLSFGLEQVARQNYQPRELVVCLHGDDFSPDVEQRLRREVEGPLEIVHVRSELTLGDALNAGVEVASGDYVTKMDDDDYYSVDHLWDLVLALEYSGADLVGKAAEFVYLEDIGLTIRRFMGDTETMSDRPLAGGGMMARREPLRELGGWPSRSRGEDTALIKRFRDAGRPLHRTHGYGYILNRHGRDHTWNTYVDYFLVQSQREWRGLRFDQTGIY